MQPRLIALVLCLGMLLGACNDSGGPPADPITGTWNGKFDNGIQIDAPLTLTGTTIAGTYGAGLDSGTVSGTYSTSTFSLQLTATKGTQRTLANAQLINSNTRITAQWDDGAGQNGDVCLAKAGSTACP